MHYLFSPLLFCFACIPSRYNIIWFDIEAGNTASGHLFTPSAQETHHLHRGNRINYRSASIQQYIYNVHIYTCVCTSFIIHKYLHKMSHRGVYRPS